MDAAAKKVGKTTLLGPKASPREIAEVIPVLASDRLTTYDPRQYYGGRARGIAFQGERLEVFPGELLVGEQRTMSSRGAARWST